MIEKYLLILFKLIVKSNNLNNYMIFNLIYLINI